MNSAAKELNELIRRLRVIYAQSYVHHAYDHGTEIIAAAFQETA